MLQFLANVDPVSLPMWAVLLLSFAMYPLGFLFGACSDCCEECPDECSKCGRYYSGNNDGPCKDITADFTIQIAGSSATGTVTNSSLSSSGIPSVSLPFTCTLDTTNDGPVTFSFTLQAVVEEVLREFSGDECGCACCVLEFYGYLEIQARAAPPFGRYDFDSISSFPGVGVKLCECDQDTAVGEMQLSTESTTLDGDVFESQNPPCGDLFAEWFNAQTMTITLSNIVPCECGACCEADGSCEVTPEFYCDATNRRDWYDFDGPEVEWQGVGTTCDPNPCPQPGACCDGGECSQTLEENCGGVFQGEGTTCDPSPC
jgi:hypothetical protein